MLVLGELDGVLGEKRGCPSAVAGSGGGEDRVPLPLPALPGGHWWLTAVSTSSLAARRAGSTAAAIPASTAKTTKRPRRTHG